MEGYAKFGRITSVQTVARNMTLQTRQLGVRELKEINMDGRVLLDMLQAIQRDHKLRTYSLNSVAYRFLGEQKEDVPYRTIADLQATDEFTRRRLAIYCVKDAYMPMRLLDKLNTLYNLIEMCRVTGIPISYIFSRGQ